MVTKPEDFVITVVDKTDDIANLVSHLQELNEGDDVSTSGCIVAVVTQNL